MEISKVVTTGLHAFYDFANQPQNKEVIKNVLSVSTFVFGAYETYEIGCDVYQIWKNHTDSRPFEGTQEHTGWKVLRVATKVSIVLAGVASRPGWGLVGVVLRVTLSSEKAEALIGAHVNFLASPWHLRHAISIVAFGLGLPATIYSIYLATSSCLGRRSLASPEHIPVGLSRRVSLVTFISRPTLHIASKVFKMCLV